MPKNSLAPCILLTGGAGFIGCALSHSLSSWDLPIVAIDNLLEQVHPARSRPSALSDGVELIVGDVSDFNVWDSLLQRYRPEIVFHLAAETGTGQSLTEASRHSITNVVGTSQMTDSFSRHGFCPSKIILSSSRAVYGEGKWRLNTGEEFYPEPRTHDALETKNWQPGLQKFGMASITPHNSESVFTRPTNVYGATKLTQEQILSSWCNAYAVPLLILRLQNVYGVGQSPMNPYTGIINIFHQIAKRGGEIPVYEDGKILRDFVYISDVTDAFVNAAEKLRKSEIIDVGRGIPISILEAAQNIASIYNAPEPIITGQFRDGDVRAAFADSSKLEKLLGLTPKVSFEDGARRLENWLKQVSS